jgi:hypothetical protein
MHELFFNGDSIIHPLKHSRFKMNAKAGFKIPLVENQKPKLPEAPQKCKNVIDDSYQFRE